MKKVIVCVFAAVMSVSAWADTEVVNGITWTFWVYGGEASVGGMSTSTAGAITIPSTLGGYPVTSIGSYAFSNCSSLTSVTIPSSVTSIGYQAFNYCSSLTSVTIPSSVTSIGDGAFQCCSGLTSVTIPEGVTSIGSYAFNYCSSLTSVTISEGVMSIGSRAFSGCRGMTSVTIPSSVTSIGVGAFSSCSGMVSYNVDSQNKNYKSVNGLLLSKDGKMLIAGVKGAVVIPEGVTSIGEYAFSGCSGLTSVTIPSSVTSIGDSAFYNCSGLMSVMIPSSVTSIGGSAFYSCNRLMSVTIPSGVTSIGYQAFYYAYNGGASRTVEFMGGSVVLAAEAFDYCGEVIFHAQAPDNLFAGGLGNATAVRYPKAYAAQYAAIYDESKFAGYTAESSCSVEVKSAKMRSTDSTIMDVTFRVNSTKPTVKVRALAFKDGVRDIVHAVRIKHYTDNYGSAIGDAITANEDHTFAWKVSDDFTNKIAKLSVDVLAVEENPLTLEFVTIPASGTHSELTIARNRLSPSAKEDAALWAWAGKDSQLRCEVVSAEWSSEYQYLRIYDGENLVGENSDYYYGDASLLSSINSLATPIVLQKLGYGVATDEQLEYAREKTGCSFSNGPYAVKK